MFWLKMRNTNNIDLVISQHNDDSENECEITKAIKNK